MGILDKDRNPVIIPKEEPKKRGCPKCGCEDFSGRRIGGANVVFTCANKDCKQQWSGGLPQVAIDPRLPHAPDPVPPPISYTKNDKGMVVEEVRAVPLTQEFRKGAPIPPPGEEDV